MGAATYAAFRFIVTTAKFNGNAVLDAIHVALQNPLATKG